MRNYDDIINKPYPFVSKHIRMSLDNRAKIFLPFAALKGYEDKISDKQKVLVSKKVLMEQQKDNLNTNIQLLVELKALKQNPFVSITYFNMVDNKLGSYITIHDYVEAIDEVYKTIKIQNTIINFNDIYNIDIDSSDD